MCASSAGKNECRVTRNPLRNISNIFIRHSNTPVFLFVTRAENARGCAARIAYFGDGFCHLRAYNEASSVSRVLSQIDMAAHNIVAESGGVTGKSSAEDDVSVLLRRDCAEARLLVTDGKYYGTRSENIADAQLASMGACSLGKRPPSVDNAVTPVMKVAKSSPSRALVPGTCASPKHKDSYYVILENGICGFKFASSAARLKRRVGPFETQETVFVKIGEMLANNRDSLRINVAMGAIGMPHVVEHVIFVTFDCDAWTARSLVATSKYTETWGASMLRVMESFVEKHERLGLDVHMKISTLFHGVRLGWLDRNEQDWCEDVLRNTASREMVGKTLCMVLFVVVYFGVTDSGPFNCMVDADGRMLLVDISTAVSVHMIQYHGKGLLPSGHKYAPAHMDQVAEYVQKNRIEVADFLVRLKATAPPNPHLVMDEQCPFFDDANIAALRSNNTDELYFLYLLREMKRNPCNALDLAMPFHANS